MNSTLYYSLLTPQAPISTGPDYFQVILVWIIYVIAMIIVIIYINKIINEYRIKIKKEEEFDKLEREVE